MKGEKGIGGAVSATDGLSEELTEEAFSKHFPSCCWGWAVESGAEQLSGPRSKWPLQVHVLVWSQPKNVEILTGRTRKAVAYNKLVWCKRQHRRRQPTARTAVLCSLATCRGETGAKHSVPVANYSLERHAVNWKTQQDKNVTFIFLETF